MMNQASNGNSSVPRFKLMLAVVTLLALTGSLAAQQVPTYTVGQAIDMANGLTAIQAGYPCDHPNLPAQRGQAATNCSYRLGTDKEQAGQVAMAISQNIAMLKPILEQFSAEEAKEQTKDYGPVNDRKMVTDATDCPKVVPAGSSLAPTCIPHFVPTTEQTEAFQSWLKGALAAPASMLNPIKIKQANLNIGNDADKGENPNFGPILTLILPLIGDPAVSVAQAKK